MRPWTLLSKKKNHFRFSLSTSRHKKSNRLFCTWACGIRLFFVTPQQGCHGVVKVNRNLRKEEVGEELIFIECLLCVISALRFIINLILIVLLGGICYDSCYIRGK